MIGSAIAADLSNEFDVTISDRDADRLQYLQTLHKINTIVLDFSKELDLSELLNAYLKEKEPTKILCNLESFKLICEL